MSLCVPSAQCGLESTVVNEKLFQSSKFELFQTVVTPQEEIREALLSWRELS